MHYDNEYLAELQELLGDYKVPEILKKTLAFNTHLEGKLYHPDFQFQIDEVLEDLFEANDLDEENIEYLLKYLIEFASADDTGGIYVFWLKEGIENVEEMPILWFGTEGEIALVASNFKEFLAHLTLENDYDIITELEKFKKWIKDEFDIDPVSSEAEVEEIAQKAKKTFQEPLTKWLTENGAEVYAEMCEYDE